MNRQGKRAIRFGVCFVFALVVVMVVPALFSGSKALAESGPPAPELEPNLGWLNTDRPLRFDRDLKGHVVLLDFWTYCCINCMHVLPDLEYLEEKYADEPFVVVGVHSAKFDEEGDRQSVRHAMRRYDIHHPVVIDDGRRIWERFGVRAWPSFVLIGADGSVIGIASGEGQREILDDAIRAALDEAKAAGTLADERVQIELDAEVASASGLRYPGKVAARAPSGGEDHGWLAIADSSNDRVILATYPDGDGRAKLVQIVGSGERGFAGGSAEIAMFNDPQGMAFGEGVLYVADTRNHAIRTIDLESFEVVTVVGTGEQGSDRRGGRAGSEQPLASPWDVELSRDGETLFIAMAGTHQLWELDIESRVARLLAGSSYENIVDGPALAAQLAQPSGLSLSSDGGTLYFADSETSAIRALDFGETREGGEVRTLIGTGLFDFGDVDGAYPDARLQHPLGVAVWSREPGDRLLIADTYNGRIKILNPAQRVVGRWLGEGSVGSDSALDLVLAEPAGLDLAVEADGSTRLFIADTNHHRVVMVDVPGRAWREVMIDGLGLGGGASGDGGAVASRTVALDTSGEVTLVLDGELPEGAKANREFPMQVRVARGREVIAQRTMADAGLPATITFPVGSLREGDVLRIDLRFGYCFDDAGVCLPGELAWAVEVVSGTPTSAELDGRVN